MSSGLVSTPAPPHYRPYRIEDIAGDIGTTRTAGNDLSLTHLPYSYRFLPQQALPKPAKLRQTLPMPANPCQY